MRNKFVTVAVRPPMDYMRIWDDAGSGADEDCSIWKIVPKDNNGINSGTFFGVRSPTRLSKQSIVSIKIQLKQGNKYTRINTS